MKSWKHYAKWIRDEETPFTLNNDIHNNDKKLRKRAKKAKKFNKKWGFRYEQTWCLDQEIAKFVLPRLAYLRDNHCGFPSCLCELDETGHCINDEDANKQWIQMLDDMCVAFELIIKDEVVLDNDKRKIQEDTIKKGLKLFAENYESLWD